MLVWVLFAFKYSYLIDLCLTSFPPPLWLFYIAFCGGFVHRFYFGIKGANASTYV